MKKLFKYHYPQIMLVIILICLFICISAFMLWTMGDFEKQLVLNTSIISGIVTVLLSTILGQTK